MYGSWRIARGVAKDRVVSTVDLESRHAHKSRASYRDGYKGHVAVEPETGLITANTVTAGNAGDAVTKLLAEEDDPVEVLGDAAYGGGQTRKHLADASHSAVIKPLPLRPPVPGGFDRDDFIIDPEAGTGLLSPPNAPSSSPSAPPPASGVCAKAAPSEAYAPPPQAPAACRSATSTTSSARRRHSAHPFRRSS